MNIPCKILASKFLDILDCGGFVRHNSIVSLKYFKTIPTQFSLKIYKNYTNLN